MRHIARLIVRLDILETKNGVSGLSAEAVAQLRRIVDEAMPSRETGQKMAGYTSKLSDKASALLGAIARGE